MNNLKVLKLTLAIVIVISVSLVGYTATKYNNLLKDSKQFTEDLAESPDENTARELLAQYVSRVQNEKNIALTSSAFRWKDARQSTNVEDKRTTRYDHSCTWYRSYLGDCN